jgi:hypothetical protein
MYVHNPGRGGRLTYYVFISLLFSSLPFYIYVSRILYKLLANEKKHNVIYSTVRPASYHSGKKLVEKKNSFKIQEEKRNLCNQYTDENKSHDYDISKAAKIYRLGKFKQ